MPGFSLHYLFGVQAYHMLPADTIKISIKNQHCAYALGLQGPDIFFYYPPAHVRKDNIGSIIHANPPGVFFQNMLDYRQRLKHQEEREIISAYIAGFLGHYTLDSLFHPYVYAHTDYHTGAKNGNEYYGRHFEMESSFDQVYLKQLKGLVPEAFYQSRTIALSSAQQHVVARMLSFVIRKTYHVNYTYSNIKHAITCMRLGTWLLHDTTGLKKKCYQWMEHKLWNYDWLSPMFQVTHPLNLNMLLNLDHNQWSNPWNQELTSWDSVPDLLKKAIFSYHLTLSLFNQELNQQPGAMERLLLGIGNRSFQNGMEFD